MGGCGWVYDWVDGCVGGRVECFSFVRCRTLSGTVWGRNYTQRVPELSSPMLRIPLQVRLLSGTSLCSHMPFELFVEY